MRILPIALAAAAIAAAVPAAAQQRDPKASAGGAAHSRDSSWAYETYELKGTDVSGLRPTGAGPDCRPAWTVASADSCRPDGTQVVHMADGCGNRQDASQACQPPKGQWAYSPSSTSGTPYTPNKPPSGFAVTRYAMTCLLTGGNGTTFGDQACTTVPPSPVTSCMVNTQGVGNCGAGVPFTDGTVQVAYQSDVNAIYTQR